MIEPLSIEAAKDKAAQEFKFWDWNSAMQAILMPATRNKLEFGVEQLTTRAMELHTASHLKAKVEEIEKALPDQLEIDVLFAEQYNRADGNMDKSRSYRAFKKGIETLRNQIITILNK